MELWKNKQWITGLLLLLGQLASFFVALSSFTSTYIADLGVRTPLTQCCLAYCWLAVVYGSVFMYRKQKLLVPWYWYIILSVIDLHGNYLVVKAFQYTSLTSVGLLNSCIIPWILILTWFILWTRYSLWQLFGAFVCVLGLVLVVLSDAGESNGGNLYPILGDILVISGTFFFALSNVGQEFCVKKKDQVEVMAMLGVFGALVSACEALIFEREELLTVTWSPSIILLFASYAASTFLFYTMIPFSLKMGGATLFNLSLLTSNAWLTLIYIFFYHQKVGWLYYIALSGFAAGLTIFSLKSVYTHSFINSSIAILLPARLKELLRMVMKRQTRNWTHSYEDIVGIGRTFGFAEEQEALFGS